MTDGKVPTDIRSPCELFRFGGSGLTVDSTDAPPLEVAMKIQAFVPDGNGWKEHV